MEKIVFEALNSAQVKVNNSVDAEKVYDITANVDIAGTQVRNISAGEVKLNNEAVATFSSWGENNLSLNYANIDASQYCSIVEAICTFIAQVKEKVSTQIINI